MKKISYEDAVYIKNYKKNHWFEKYFCNWFINMKSPTCGEMKLYMKKWVYILLFIPIHLIVFGYCLWDGGIREFEINSRMLHFDNIIGLTYNNDDSTSCGRFKKVWEKVNK